MEKLIIGNPLLDSCKEVAITLTKEGLVVTFNGQSKIEIADVTPGRGKEKTVAFDEEAAARLRNAGADPSQVDAKALKV